MHWLNHNHLLQFWMVVREGGVAPAAKRLGLSHSTISTQIHNLEESLGERLFVKQGRKLVLTESGRLVYRYSDKIFILSRELTEALRGNPTGKPQRFVVGIAESVPKMLARRILSPAQSLEQPTRLICREDRPERLFAELALHSLDLVLSDSPVPAGSNLRLYSHLLGESQLAFFAPKTIAKKLKKGFPDSLQGVPMLLPLEESPLRRSLERWFEEHKIQPNISAEFEDSALLKTFARDSVAVFPAPRAITKDLAEQYRVELFGVVSDIKESFYAITAERRLRHPAVVAISMAAKRELFGA